MVAPFPCVSVVFFLVLSASVSFNRHVPRALPQDLSAHVACFACALPNESFSVVRLCAHPTVGAVERGGPQTHAGVRGEPAAKCHPGGVVQNAPTQLIFRGHDWVCDCAGSGVGVGVGVSSVVAIGFVSRSSFVSQNSFVCC